MTTTEYLQLEIRRTELSIRRAERKPNTPAEELRGLHEKLEHMQEALEAVEEHWQRVHEQRGWTARIDLDKWTAEWADNDQGEEMMCKCSKCGYPVSYFWGKTAFCPGCGRAMTPEAWTELERRVCGG